MLEITAPIIVLALSGIFAMLGLGGASIYVPIFFWLGMPLEAAIVTGLFINIVTTLVSSLIFHKEGLLTKKDYGIAAFIFAGSFLGAPVGAWLASILPAQAILGAFSIILLISAWRMHSYKEKKGRVKGLTAEEAGFAEEAGGQAMGSALRRGAMGGGTGVVSGTLGIGGGIFLVPFLIDSGVNPRRAAVLSHVCTLFASTLGFVSHFLLQSASFSITLAAPVGVAALIGSYFGSTLLVRNKISSGHIRMAFIALLVLFSIKLMLDALGVSNLAFALYD